MLPQVRASGHKKAGEEKKITAAPSDRINDAVTQRRVCYSSPQGDLMRLGGGGFPWLELYQASLNGHAVVHSIHKKIIAFSCV